MKRISAFCLAVLSIFFMGVAYNPRVVRSQSPATATSAATVVVATKLDPPPTKCGPTPELLPVDQYTGPVLGSWPMWASLSMGLEGRIAGLSMSTEHFIEESSLPGWWGQKVMWLVKRSYHGEVKLHGFNVADNSPVYFQLNDKTPVSIAVMDPAHPGAGAEGSEVWAYFPSYVFVSKAGCYTFEADWDGGLWRQTIAVGYVAGS